MRLTTFSHLSRKNSSALWKIAGNGMAHLLQNLHLPARDRICALLRRSSLIQAYSGDKVRCFSVWCSSLLLRPSLKVELSPHRYGPRYINTGICSRYCRSRYRLAHTNVQPLSKCLLSMTSRKTVRPSLRQKPRYIQFKRSVLLPNRIPAD